MPLACLCFVASLVFAVFTARALYDDGSYYFLRVLEAGGFADLVFSRNYADYLYQIPLVIALKSGINDLAGLQIAFGVGCFISWPLAMGMCLRLAPKHFWLVVLACGAGYLNAAFSAVAEHIVAHAFFWPVCFVVLFVRPLTAEAAVMLLVSAFILVCSYESMLFFGPLLGGLAFRRAASSEEKSWSKIIFLTASALLFISVPIALDGILHPGHGSNAGSFEVGFFKILLSPDWTICWTIVWTLLMLLGCWSSKFRTWICSRAGIVLISAVVCLWGAWPLLVPAQLDPYKQYHARFLDLLVPLALLPVALLLKRFPDWFASRKNYLANLSAVMLLAQSLWHIAATEQWRGYLAVLRNLMASQSGIIKLMDTPYGQYPAVGHQATRFVWELDMRNMCVEIGPSKVKSLVLPNPIIDGELVNRILLDQYKPENLPDLSRYGIDYSEYVKALAGNPPLVIEPPKPEKR